MKQLELRISGRVQGVNFRNTVHKYALGLGLKGLVENKKDGTVRVVAQGQKEVLIELLNWIKDCPGLSNVKEVEENWGMPEETYETFTVKKESKFLKDQISSMKNLSRNLR